MTTFLIIYSIIFLISFVCACNRHFPDKAVFNYALVIGTFPLILFLKFGIFINEKYLINEKYKKYMVKKKIRKRYSYLK